MSRAIYQFFFNLFGWKVVGKKPDLKKFVLIAAPHTSNWDFFVGLAARNLSNLNSQFLAKKSLFDIPLVGWFVRKMGGHPVDRTKKTHIVDQVVDLFNQNEEFVITITPEGTRSYREKWRTGFYRIAEKANVPIVMVGFDFAKKEVNWQPPFYPTGDLDADIEVMKSYFRTVKGKHPKKGVL